MEVMLRLADLFEPRFQIGYLFSRDSELLTAVEAMHVMHFFEPTQGHPEHCAALGVLALERYPFFFISHDCF
jgi:hypothetical protein